MLFIRSKSTFSKLGASHQDQELALEEEKKYDSEFNFFFFSDIN